VRKTNQKAYPVDGNVAIGRAEIFNGQAITVDFDLNKFFQYYIDEQLGEVIENYSPVAQKTVGVEQCKGIKISGSFRTNMDVDLVPGYDGMCYITVRRNSSGEANAACGYGVAFRPSFPDVDVTATIGEAPTFDPLTSTYDVVMGSALDAGFVATGGIAYYSDGDVSGVIFKYGSAAEATLSDCAFPDNIIPVSGGEVNLASNNIFIVDNDLIGSDIYNHNVIEYDSGIMAYLASDAFEILPDTLYYYEISINSNNSISVLISEDQTEMGSEVIGYGAYTPLSEYLETDNMDAFGVGVVNTRGYKWEFGQITLSNISGEYPVAYFKMNVATMPSEFQAHLRARGLGYLASTPTEGLNLYVYDITAGSWVLLLSNTYTDLSSSSLVSVSESIPNTSQYVDDDNIVEFYVTSEHPSGVADEEAYLEIDYFKIKAAVNASMHIGACVDVYIDDPNLRLATVTATPSTGYSEITGFSDRAVVWIDEVRAVVGGSEYALLPGIDYQWYVNNEEFRGSTRVKHSIRFNSNISGNVKIDYYYSPLVSVVQSHVADAYVTFSGQDVLAKHLNLHMLEITTDGTGIPALVKEYIDTLQKTGDSYFLRWNLLRQYILATNEMTELEIVDTYREDGVLKQQTINQANDYIEITKIEAFRVKELINA